jgi:hypothetical protein
MVQHFKTGLILCISILTFGFTQAQEPKWSPPTVQDCAGAIPVCQPVYTTTASYTGHGNVYPEIHNNGVCPLCMDGEKNDVFYIITVQTSGILRFKLTPNNPSNDYDWELFNMTNADCAQLYTNASQLTVSCNSYGVTGTNGPTGINTAQSNNLNCNGPGNTNGPAFNKDLIVHAGQTYLLNVSNWSSTNQSGYTLDFSESTASIFDNVPPAIDSVQASIPCSGATSLFVRFTENVKCADVYQHPEAFSITGGSGGPYSVTGVTSSTCASGANQSPNYYLSVTPPIHAGTYSLNIVGIVHDLCGNAALNAGFSFALTELNAPVALAGNDTTVPYGSVITLHGHCTGGTHPISYHWEPASLLVNADVQNPTTSGAFTSTIFTLTVTDSLGCLNSDDKLVTVTGGPLSVNASSNPQTLCTGQQAVLTALASGGGTGNYTYSWTSNPTGFTSNIMSPTVMPTVTTVYTVQVVDGNTQASGSATVHVNQLPVALPGTGFSIPYGTNAILHGSASGGNGGYSYSWTSNPAGYTSALQDPTFVNVTATTIFYLTVTDMATGCVSQPVPLVVTVTGGPLATSPVASPSTICKYASTHIYSMTGGGSGTYTWSWASNPPGFASTQSDPLVSPLETTVYNVTVNDGFNQTTGSVYVYVDPTPVIVLGPVDTTVCVFDTIALDAGNEGSEYYWSNGASTRMIKIGTTGLGYDFQTYKVIVTNHFGCVDSASINVIFSYTACSGINDQFEGAGISVFPNPGNGLLTIRGTSTHEDIEILVYNLVGDRIAEEKIDGKKDAFFEKTFDLTRLPAGVYFLRLISAGKTQVKKFVIH